MTSKEVDRQLLLTYLEGNCTRNQLLQIREYLHDEAYSDSLNQFMEDEWGELNRGQLLPLASMDDKYKKFRSAYITPQKRKPAPVIRWIGAVAAACLLVAVGIWLFEFRPGSGQAHDAAIQQLSWYSRPGQHREIVLPDSSLVYLGPRGRLQYWENGDSSRFARLEGEAYFVVKHDIHRSFTVVSGGLSTRDIGTEFNIRYFPGETVIAIAVASGKVQVFHSPVDATSAAIPEAAPFAALTAGQLLQYDSLTQRSGITEVPNPSTIGAWRKGILSFHRQRLKEVTDELQRYYGVSFHYSDPAAKDILITTILEEKNLGDALDIVSLTAGVHFTHEGNEILIK